MATAVNKPAEAACDTYFPGHLRYNQSPSITSFFHLLTACKLTISPYLPGSSSRMAHLIDRTLSARGFTERNTLFATRYIASHHRLLLTSYLSSPHTLPFHLLLLLLSVCPDEVNSKKGELTDILREKYGECFTLGGKHQWSKSVATLYASLRCCLRPEVWAEPPFDPPSEQGWAESPSPEYQASPPTATTCLTACTPTNGAQTRELTMLSSQLRSLARSLEPLRKGRRARAKCLWSSRLTWALKPTALLESSGAPTRR